MSSPPPYPSASSTPSNPDKRPLPAGWIEQYDKNYNTWFYVNTRENPPKSSWVHPLGPPPTSPPPQSYAPPPGPPPPSQPNYSQSPYPPQGGYNQGPPAPQPWGGAPYGGGPPQGGWGYQGGGGYPQHSWQQGPPSGQGWYGAPQPPQQVVYVEKNKDKKDKDKKYKGGGGGMGMGTVLAAGGAGLVGGMLLENALDDHNDYEREMGYQEGFQDGADFGDGDGGDW